MLKPAGKFASALNAPIESRSWHSPDAIVALHRSRNPAGDPSHTLNDVSAASARGASAALRERE